MLAVEGSRAVSFCDGLRRRDFLHIGTLSLFGLSLTSLFSLKARGARNPPKNRNCIFLFLVGGPSQLDTWDMKPDAPSEIRGPYRPISTNADGIQVCELFPRMAGHADKFSLVRTVYHRGANHELGYQQMQTGRLFQGGLEHPHAGCVLAKVRGSKADLPPHVLLPRALEVPRASSNGQNAGYLGKAYDPFILNADPSQPDFKVQDLVPPDHISSVRLETRRSLRQVVDSVVGDFEKSNDARLLDSNFEQAYRLISSAQAREAFDIGQEQDDVRRRYGPTRFGQSCLLARRLVERAVPFVTVNMFDTNQGKTWDVHGSAPFTPLSTYDESGPIFDHGFSSLVEDLHERGLLESTLVVAMGEFGRTPKINPAGGRDHWPNTYTVVFAGGGVQGGRVVGVSDDIGGTPKDRPVRPQEVVATVYHSLGIDLETELEGPQGRPIRLVDHGIAPIHELF